MSFNPIESGTVYNPLNFDLIELKDVQSKFHENISSRGYENDDLLNISIENDIIKNRSAKRS